ncbi:ABC transporter, periplasmic spermidine putrescine-binding protein PotD [Acidisarcina polymorpha]|uniref:ABC transporter, periplasmic spermidine putrescine-binding protein PotD n=1 Tax=Acidisarcina polymorpha TaxID=2211140 RepID=A0A2Z5G1V6_9BACT|nr:ABC transporter substrate-binding protein [Acidisarcina polymorpha]AXC13058.1 ABC transporter, periplasmic spermidine putrescine-binding protein PotD [Acidisarcina polymorpha]
MKKLLVLTAISALLLLSSCKRPLPTLSLLVWEGYANPSFIQGFEATCRCKVNAAYMGSSDEMVAKLRGGAASNYDVISPSSDVATMLTQSGLTAPLDLAKLPNYAQVSPVLTLLPLVKKDGKVYGVPLTWGPNPLLYDKSYYSEAPQSWDDLWDPKLRGKISVWDDLSTIYMAAQVLGFDKPDPLALYNLNDQQLEQVKQKLIALEPNIRKIWTTGGELTNLFQNHEIVAAMGWPLMTNQLRKLNFPIGETIPRQGTTGWIDHLMITTASGNKDLALSFLNYMIAAQTQKELSDVTGYIPANPSAASLMTPEQRHNLHLDDVDAYQKKIIFWQDVPRRAKYTEIWNSVKASD